MKIVKKKRGVTAFTLAIMFSISMLTQEKIYVKAESEDNDYELNNPRIEYNTRDSIYFGNYWQEDTNGDGTVDQKDEKQPIRWQILSKDGDDVFLLADKILDSKRFNDEGIVKIDDNGNEYTDYYCTWETSTLRKWLNEDFINAAFTESEKKAIQNTIVTDDISFIENDNGELNYNPDEIITKDKIFLLSKEEAFNDLYMFDSESDEGYQARAGKYSDFANEHGYRWKNFWWLRSPLYEKSAMACVSNSGNYVSCEFDAQFGVRPALHLDLSLCTSTISENINVSIKNVEYDTVVFGKYEGHDLVWRVLQVNENDAFLLSDRYIEKMQYDKNATGQYPKTTWSDSVIRAWLNDDFYNSSFNDNEKAMIKTTYIKNDDNQFFLMDGGEDTYDNVFLLSLSDIVNTDYGFPSDYEVDSKARAAESFKGGSSDDWWLRSPGCYSDYIAVVLASGYAYPDGHPCRGYNRIRPALHIDLSVSSWSKGPSIVCGNKETPISEPTATPTKDPDITPSPTSEPTPTKKPDSTPSPTSEPTSIKEPTSESTSTVVSTSQPTATVTPTTVPSPAVAKDNVTTFSIKNKAKVKSKAKIKIKDKDKIKKITLNGKTIKIKKNKTSFTLKLKSYKKKLKKKGKWNKLVVIDAKGNKKTIKFKTK